MISLKRITSLSAGVKSQLPILGEIYAVQRRNGSSYSHLTTYGSGGRNSFNGNVVTVFGGTGFMGRYVINRLAKSGTQLIVPYRGCEDECKHLRLMGDLGQIVFLKFDIRDPESVAKCMTHSTGVVNLIGKNFSNRNFQMREHMVEGAERIAKIAGEAGVGRMVHMSHLCASEDSPSEYMRIKAESEKVVSASFPDATILKSADAYGDEDKYLNRYAYYRNMLFGIPMVGSGWETTKRPIYIGDVAQAVVNSVLQAGHGGRTYEICGTEEYFLADVLDYVMRVIRNDQYKVVNVPLAFLRWAGWAMEQVPIFEPKRTEDQFIREFLSEVMSEDAYTLADLGIEPQHIDVMGLNILRRHRTFFTYNELRDESDACKPITAYQ